MTRSGLIGSIRVHARVRVYTWAKKLVPPPPTKGSEEKRQPPDSGQHSLPVLGTRSPCSATTTHHAQEAETPRRRSLRARGPRVSLLLSISGLTSSGINHTQMAHLIKKYLFLCFAVPQRDYLSKLPICYGLAGKLTPVPFCLFVSLFTGGVSGLIAHGPWVSCAHEALRLFAGFGRRWAAAVPLVLAGNRGPEGFLTVLRSPESSREGTAALPACLHRHTLLHSHCFPISTTRKPEGQESPVLRGPPHPGTLLPGSGRRARPHRVLCFWAKLSVQSSFLSFFIRLWRQACVPPPAFIFPAKPSFLRLVSLKHGRQGGS